MSDIGFAQYAAGASASWSKIMGVSKASVGKINGVAIASIGKVNGVS